ncbi:MAG: MarC family protein [Candidatus Diapherotrites archaeon]
MIELIEAFILLLVIMNPILSLGALLSMSEGKSEKEKKAIAVKSVLVAAFVFFLFAFAGNIALDILGTKIDSFRAAGGIILILLGIQMSLGIRILKEKEEVSETAVVIGTPLISGPATITTTILLVNDTGLGITLAAGTIALIVILFTLLISSKLGKIVGHSGMRVLSTMMGIVTISWGIQFLLEGAMKFIGA